MTYHRDIRPMRAGTCHLRGLIDVVSEKAAGGYIMTYMLRVLGTSIKYRRLYNGINGESKNKKNEII